MPSVAQKLMVAVQADASALDTLASKSEQSFSRIRVAARESTAGIDAIANRITRLAAGTELEGTRAASLQRLVAVESQLQKVLQTGNLSLDERIRVETQAARASRAIADAQTGLVPALRGQGEAVGSLRDRYATAALVMANAGETMARTGDLSGKAASKILEQVSGIAFAFGSTGIIVASVAIATKTIIEFFRRARDEADQTIEKLRKARLERLGIDSEALNDAKALAAERKRLEALANLKPVSAVPFGPGEGSFPVGPTQEDIENAKRRLRELDQLAADVARSQQERQFEVFRQEVQHLVTLREANKLTNAERAKAAQIEQNLQAALVTLGHEQEAATGDRVAQIRAQRAAIVDLLATMQRQGLTEAKIADASAEAFSGIEIRFRDLHQAFQDLGASVEEPGDEVVQLQAKLRELGDKADDIGAAFARIKNPTKAQTDEFQRQKAIIDADRAAAEQLVGVLSQRRAKQLSDDLRELFASMTTTQVDNLTLSLGKLLEKLKAEGASSELLDLVASTRREFIQAVGDTEALEKRLEEGRRRMEGISAGPDAKRLAVNAQIKELLGEQSTIQIQLAALGLQGSVADEARVERQKQLALIQQRIKELTADAVRDTSSLSSVLATVANVGFGIATSFLGADDAVTRLLGNVAHLAEQLVNLQELASKAGGLSKLFSTGAGVASGLGALGGIIGAIGGITSLFGGDSPAERERKRILQENNQRLKDLRDGLVAVTHFSVSGKTLSSIAGVPLPTEQDIVGKIDDAGIAHAHAILIRATQDAIETFRQAGVSLDDLRVAARDFGITLSDRPTIQELQDLQQAISEFSIALATFGDQMDVLDARVRLGGVTAAQALERTIASARTELAAGLKSLDIAPTLLDAVDFSSKAAFERTIQPILDAFESDGELSEAEQSQIAVLEKVADAYDAATAEADQLARAVTDAVAGTFDAIGTEVSHGVLTASDGLQQMIAAFTRAFPDLAQEVSFAGADAFRESIKPIIARLASDGVLTDAEKAQLAVLDALAQAFDAAAQATQSFVDGMTVVKDRAAILGEDLATQFTETVQAFVQKGGGFSILAGLGDGLDLTKASDFQQFRQQVQEIFRDLSIDGITASEQEIVDALQTILDAGQAIFDAAAQQAEEGARQAEADRQARNKAVLDRAHRDIDFNNLDPVKTFQAMADAFGALSPAIHDLFEELDLTTAAGIAEAKRRLAEYFDAIQRGDTITGLGSLTFDEFTDAILGLGDSADQAGEQVAGLASTLAEQFSGLKDDLSTSLDIRNITDPLERAIETIKQFAGLSPELTRITAGADLTSSAGRAALDQALQQFALGTTDATLREAAQEMLHAIRAIPDAVVDGLSGPSAGTGPQTFTGTLQFTAIQGDRLLDYERTQIALLRMIEGNTRAGGLASLGTSFPPLAPIRPPALPSAISVSGGTVTVNLTYHAGPVTFHGVPVDAQRELKRLTDREVEDLQKRLAEVLDNQLRSRGITARS